MMKILRRSTKIKPLGTNRLESELRGETNTGQFRGGGGTQSKEIRGGDS